MNHKIILSFIIGTAISLATLYLAFRNVPFQDLVNYLSSIQLFWIVPAVLLVIVGFTLRAVRWRYILAGTQKVAFWNAFHPLMIGFMINCVLPGRVGEIARPLVLNRREGLPMSTGLATVVVERIFDMLILLALFLLVSLTIDFDRQSSMQFAGYQVDFQTLEKVFNGMLQLGALLLLAIATVSFQKSRRIVNNVVLALPGTLFFVGEALRDKMYRKVCRPIVGIIDNVAEGMAMVKKPRRVAACFSFSLAIWFIHAVSYYVFAIGCPDIDITLLEMTMVMIIICFVIALPSVPGYWGLWEAGGVFAMSLFGVPPREAAGFTLANHAIQILPVILVGLISAWISGINIVQVSYQEG
ncbi:MAG TPA: lysylphosphatidylglycerol synthase transmembrane domain-containing protein [Desulfobacterales bacterium]